MIGCYFHFHTSIVISKDFRTYVPEAGDFSVGRFQGDRLTPEVQSLQMCANAVWQPSPWLMQKRRNVFLSTTSVGEVVLQTNDFRLELFVLGLKSTKHILSIQHQTAWLMQMHYSAWIIISSAVKTVIAVF